MGIKKKNNQITIPSSLDYLPKVDEYVEGKLRKLGVDKDRLADIAVSVTEAVTNAVLHGNQNDLKKKVQIELKADLLKEAGRGIFILKSLMDEVDFIISPKKGTIVKMTKFLS